MRSYNGRVITSIGIPPCNPFYKVPLAAGLLAVLGTGTIQAAPTANSAGPLEDIVITASRFEQRLFDSPASISVIDELDLSHSTAYALADLLRDVPGVQ